MGGYNEIYDVIVCGGGTSGVAAAICAARVGAKTLLIERCGTLGGQLTMSGPPGFAYPDCLTPEMNEMWVVSSKKLTKIASRACSAAYALAFRAKAGYSFSYIDRTGGYFDFDMMEEEGVVLLLNSLVVDVTRKRKKTP